MILQMILLVKLNYDVYVTFVLCLPSDWKYTFLIFALKSPYKIGRVASRKTRNREKGAFCIGRRDSSRPETTGRWQNV